MELAVAARAGEIVEAPGLFMIQDSVRSVCITPTYGMLTTFSLNTYDSLLSIHLSPALRNAAS